MPIPAMLLGLVVAMLSLTVGSASAAGWLEPKDISAANEVVDGRPEVAADEAGNAVAIWERHVDGEEIVEATERPAGGDWSEPETISLPGEEGEQSQVTIDASGNAIAVWITGDLATDFVVRSAVRPPGGEWSEPEDVSDSIEGVFPRLVVDAAGEAVAVWTAFGDSSFIVQGAVRSADGEWSEPDDLSDEGVTPLEAPDVAIDASGNAIAVWKLDGSSDFIVQAALRPAGEDDWEEPDDLSAAGQDAGEPAVAMNGAGEAVAVWTRLDGEDIIQAALRPAGGDWEESEDLSTASENAGEPAVAMNDDGEAVAVWRRFNGSTDIAQATTLPAGGDWEEPEDLSNSSQSAISPVVAISDAGDAVAMWHRSDGTDLRVQGVVRSPDGNWSSPDTLSAAGEDAGFPKVATDAAGNAFAVFGRKGDDGPFVQATGYDFVGPQIRNLQIPATGTVGEPVFFSVSPFDVFPLGATSWTFGDGSQAASGNAVSHVYSAPGAYPVTVSVFDASGNASTQTGAIAIAAAPVKPPPPACTVPQLVGKKLARAKAALRAAGCKLGKVQRPKPRKGKRRRALVVKSSSPAAGAQPADGKVDLRLGPKPRKARR